MGYKLHVAKKYHVEYADITGFNNYVDEFHSLLRYCGAYYTGESYDMEFEVEKSDWMEVIRKLKNLDSLSREERDDIISCLESMNCTKEDTVRIMEKMLEMSEPNEYYLHLQFF